MALYAKELIVVLSQSPDYAHAVSANSAESKISRWRLFFVCYCKKFGRGIASEAGMWRLMFLILTVGWALGTRAIENRTPLTSGWRVAVGVGFAIGVKAAIYL